MLDLSECKTKGTLLFLHILTRWRVLEAFQYYGRALDLFLGYFVDVAELVMVLLNLLQLDYLCTVVRHPGILEDLFEGGSFVRVLF